LAQIAIFAVLMIISGKLAIPFLTIPFTLQTAACLLTGLLLGPRKGLAALALYIVLGLAGLPVFAGGGGPAYLLQPSFGFLLGMTLAAALAGVLSEQIDPHRRGFPIWQGWLVCLAGLPLIYGAGVGYLMALKNVYLEQPLSLLAALRVGMLPFLVTDSLQALLAAVVGSRLRRLTRPFFQFQPGPAGPL
jgi:biotin transport system substrate-specific component